MPLICKRKLMEDGELAAYVDQQINDGMISPETRDESIQRLKEAMGVSPTGLAFKRHSSRSTPIKHVIVLKASDCGADTGSGGGFGTGNSCAGGSGNQKPESSQSPGPELNDSPKEHDPQTDTVEFAEFYGDGPKHADGEPIEFYHGTKQDFTEFSGKTRSQDGLIFFSSNPEMAGAWPVGTGGGRVSPNLPSKEKLREMKKDERVMQWEVVEELSGFDRDGWIKEEERIDNVFGGTSDESLAHGDLLIGKESRDRLHDRFRSKYGFDSVHDMERLLDVKVIPTYVAAQKPFYPPRDHPKIAKFLGSLEGYENLVKRGKHEVGNWAVYENPKITKWLDDQGYDGIWLTETTGDIAKHETLAVWDPKKIKSSIGNDGNFNPDEGDITKSLIVKVSGCGSDTGADGGFGPGNDCAGGDGSSEKEKPKGTPGSDKELRKQQQQTEEFKQFFVDSKVVGEDGNPIVVYHGTNRDFTSFDPNEAGVATPLDPGLIGPAFYFTVSEDQAEQFSLGAQFRDVQQGRATQEEGAVVMPVYLSMKNPARIKDGRLPDGRMLSDLYPRGISAETGRALQDGFKAQGYDGVILSVGGGDEQFVVFDPKQIKSASSNSGTFNPDDTDITKSLIVKVSEASSRANPLRVDIKKVELLHYLVKLKDKRNNG